MCRSLFCFSLALSRKRDGQRPLYYETMMETEKKENGLSFSIYFIFFSFLNVSCVLLSSYITRSRFSCTVFAPAPSPTPFFPPPPLPPAAFAAHLLDNRYENTARICVSGHHRIPTIVRDRTIVYTRVDACNVFCMFLPLNEL